MQRTLHYNFPLFEGEDVPSIIESWNPTMAAIDAKLYALSIGNAGPEIIHELQELIATVNDLIATVNEVISNVDNVQDTVNGIQRNMSTIYDTLRTLQTEIDNLAAEIPDVSQIEGEISQLRTSVMNLSSSLVTKMSLVDRSSFPTQPVYVGDGVKIYMPYWEKTGNTPPYAEMQAWMKGSVFYFSDWDDVKIVVSLPDGSELNTSTLQSYQEYRGNSINSIEFEDTITGTMKELWFVDYRKVGGSSPTPVTTDDSIIIIKSYMLENAGFELDTGNFAYYLRVQRTYNSEEDMLSDLEPYQSLFSSGGWLNPAYLDGVPVEFRVYDNDNYTVYDRIEPYSIAQLEVHSRYIQDAEEFWFSTYAPFEKSDASIVKAKRDWELFVGADTQWDSTANQYVLDVSYSELSKIQDQYKYKGSFIYIGTDNTLLRIIQPDNSITSTSINLEKGSYYFLVSSYDSVSDTWSVTNYAEHTPLT